VLLIINHVYSITFVAFLRYTYSSTRSYSNFSISDGVCIY